VSARTASMRGVVWRRAVDSPHGGSVWHYRRHSFRRPCPCLRPGVVIVVVIVVVVLSLSAVIVVVAVAVVVFPCGYRGQPSTSGTCRDVVVPVHARSVVVDVERGRTVPGWLPRKFGGGIGDTRKGSKTESVAYSGR
jgi:hypothetical protein